MAGIVMQARFQPWDYLILTASNAQQSQAYEAQLRIRRKLELISGLKETLVIPDLRGKRIGSGGSTVLCLLEVLRREVPPTRLADPAAWREALERLRILIVHAGGDSRRLPAYGPCGKLFIPVPGESDSAVGPTLLDRQLPTYLALPPQADGAGQVVITAGDVLLLFDPSEVRFAPRGLTGLACSASPKEAGGHGVYRHDEDGTVRQYLQKPSVAHQEECGMVDRYGRSNLDIGIISFDAAAAVSLLRACEVQGREGRLSWSGPAAEMIEGHGMDFYQEICGAIGTDTDRESYHRQMEARGCRWPRGVLANLYDAMHGVPAAVQVLRQCSFLHFGSGRQLIASGLDLLQSDGGIPSAQRCLSINNLTGSDTPAGSDSWVEGCRLEAPLKLCGDNLVVGVDLDAPLELPRGACLDVIEGNDRQGRRVHFVRCYRNEDNFKDSAETGTFCGRPVGQWLSAVGAGPQELWPHVPPADRTLWTARLFPAEAEPAGFRRWLWMYEPAQATAEERQTWLSAERYSLAEVAERADPKAFYDRRAGIRAHRIGQSLRWMFRAGSDFSAAELAFVLAHSENRPAIVARLLADAEQGLRTPASGPDALGPARLLHTLGSAIQQLGHDPGVPLVEAVPGLEEALSGSQGPWLASAGLSPGLPSGPWCAQAKTLAFEVLGQTIVGMGSRDRPFPRNSLRKDEIVWGRAAARLDLGGGWTDTPPYSLEHGGCVINAAVNLNGQPPIHTYARVIQEPVIRITSVDLGTRVEIRRLEELLDYRKATSDFSLAKAALAISGFAPRAAAWRDGMGLPEMLEQFGGGIELTTLAAIPKGSGLGTSSIAGAVILSVIHRMMGRILTRQELFHGVLQLEQSLTTGGGWQDQIGGVVDGVKIIATRPGLVPDALIHYVPGDVLDPHANGGCTLLYYTGITRLAKNILHQVVGRYLDHQRSALATLRRLHALPHEVADAMARKDLPAFGHQIDLAWRLNTELDPHSSTPQIEAIQDGIQKYTYGAKLLGAGGGGFLLIVCKSPRDAQAVREKLTQNPPNQQARFFDYDISPTGLAVTVC